MTSPDYFLAYKAVLKLPMVHKSPQKNVKSGRLKLSDPIFTMLIYDYRLGLLGAHYLISACCLPATGIG